MICTVRRVSSGETMIPVRIWDARGTRRGGAFAEKNGRRNDETEGWIVDMASDSVTDVRRPFQRLGQPSVLHPPTRFIMPQTPSAGPYGMTNGDRPTLDVDSPVLILRAFRGFARA